MFKKSSRNLFKHSRMFNRDFFWNIFKGYSIIFSFEFSSKYFAGFFRNLYSYFFKQSSRGLFDSCSRELIDHSRSKFFSDSSRNYFVITYCDSNGNFSRDSYKSPYGDFFRISSCSCKDSFINAFKNFLPFRCENVNFSLSEKALDFSRIVFFYNNYF